MAYINVGKENTTAIDIYYEDHGSGRPIVLIHGFPLSGVAWEKQVSVLLKAGYRTITYDRRGFGKSSQTGIGYDFDTFTSDLNTLMESLDLHDVTLVGHSMGAGEVARYFGNHGAKRVRQAVFISSIAPFLLKTNDNPEGIDASFYNSTIQSFTADRPTFMAEFFKDFFNLDVTLGKRISEEVLRAYWNLAVSASPLGTVACVPTWHTDFRKDLPHVTVPSLIIHGADDRILPLALTAQHLHEAIKGSQLVVLKDGPHGIFWTHADEINQALLDFLK